MENYYEILNVTPSCTLDELRMNYKKLLLKYHPDKKVQTTSAITITALNATSSSSSSTTTTTTAKIQLTDKQGSGRVVAAAAAAAAAYQYKDDNNEKFLSISEAWNCLKDPIKRKQYDAELMLQKFQKHLLNIYANISLNDMSLQKKEKCSTRPLSNDSCAMANFDEAFDKASCNCYHHHHHHHHYYYYNYYYTYNCRCGGQYILNYDDCNESIEEQQQQQQQQQKQIKHDNSCKYLVNNENSAHGRMEENSKGNMKLFNCAKAEEVIAFKNYNNNNNNNANNNDNNNNDDDNDDDEEKIKQKTIDKQEVNKVQEKENNEEEEEQQLDENKETGTELIVECSECSLAIIVNV